MQLSHDKSMIVYMLMDVLQYHVSFILPTLFQLIMNYTLLTTKRNGAKLHFKTSHTQKKKVGKTQTRRTEGSNKTIQGSFGFVSIYLHYHQTNPAKKKLVPTELAI